MGKLSWQEFTSLVAILNFIVVDHNSRGGAPCVQLVFNHDAFLKEAFLCLLNCKSIEKLLWNCLFLHTGFGVSQTERR